MDDSISEIEVIVLAFGPLAERLGSRRHLHTVSTGSTVAELVRSLGLEEWLSFGLSVAINGERCGHDAPIQATCEVALLPPVSGG